MSVYFKKFFLCFIMICSLLFVNDCFASERSTEKHVPYTVKMTANVQSYLYFQGSIQPIKQYDILSPIAGLVSKDLNFNYGELVKKNQYLMSITPSDEEASYRSSLISYLRAKSSYASAQAKFSGQQLLYNNKILARNDFQQYKDNLTDQKIALREALYSLTAVVKKISSDKKVEQNIVKTLSSLTISDQQVYDELNRSFSEVKIHAPYTGIALLPPKTRDSSDSLELHKDSAVKLEQALLAIGDFSGLQVKIDVSEVSINKLHLGQAAEVTGPAFPTMTLKGKIKTISYQSKSDDMGGGLPVFPVTIVVSKLTPAQQKIIHAGMTAKVKISLQQGSKLMVPIAAVHTTKGKSFVLKIVAGKYVNTPVSTGNTTQTQVEIIKGLKVGDKIALTD